MLVTSPGIWFLSSIHNLWTMGVFFLMGFMPLSLVCQCGKFVLSYSKSCPCIMHESSFFSRLPGLQVHKYSMNRKPLMFPLWTGSGLERGEVTEVRGWGKCWAVIQLILFKKKKSKNLCDFLLFTSTYSMFGLLFTLQWGKKLFYYLVPDVSNVLGTISVPNIREWEEKR